MQLIQLTSNGTPYHGAIRWNGSSCLLEVMDQFGGWSPISFSIMDSTPPLPSDANELLEWARMERTRQNKLKLLREKYPSLDSVLNQAEVIEALVSEYKTS